MTLGIYGKALTALITGLIGWATMVANHPGGFHHIEAPLWIAFATVWAVAFGVYGVANAPASTNGSEAIEPVIVRLDSRDISAIKAAAQVKGAPAKAARKR